MLQKLLDPSLPSPHLWDLFLQQIPDGIVSIYAHNLLSHKYYSLQYMVCDQSNNQKNKMKLSQKQSWGKEWRQSGSVSANYHYIPIQSVLYTVMCPPNITFLEQELFHKLFVFPSWYWIGLAILSLTNVMIWGGFAQPPKVTGYHRYYSYCCLFTDFSLATPLLVLRGHFERCQENTYRTRNHVSRVSFSHKALWYVDQVPPSSTAPHALRLPALKHELASAFSGTFASLGARQGLPHCA